MSEKNLAGQIESVNMPRRKLLMGLSALPALSILSSSLLAGKALAAQAQGWPLWEVTGKSGKGCEFILELVGGNSAAYYTAWS